MPDFAFTELVEKHSSLVYNVALRMMGNPQDAEDITQEVFLSAFKALPNFRGQSEVSTWLYRIAVNACLMKIRKEKKSRYLVDTGYEDIDIPDWAESPEKAALNTELHETIQDGLARLPPDLRTAVVLRDVQGLSGEEAANVLGIPVATLKTRLHRGRLLLRKHLGTYLGKKG
ncbi:MAG: sigma-70 family RNA polymerase sigma factor [Chloroflexi bacterium]|nr:sigma-70 family RNA polymerase sigma factor [Chloroflexota bacterium]